MIFMRGIHIQEHALLTMFVVAERDRSACETLFLSQFGRRLGAGDGKQISHFRTQHTAGVESQGSDQRGLSHRKASPLKRKHSSAGLVFKTPPIDHPIARYSPPRSLPVR